MKTNHEPVVPTPASLLTEIHTLVAEAEKRIGAMQAETHEEVAGDLRARLEAAQECLTGMYSGAKKKVLAGARQTDGAIRANPYESIAIAAGIALVIGVIAGRRLR